MMTTVAGARAAPMRAALTAARLLGRACGIRLAREHANTAAAATILELRVALVRAEQEITLLTGRLLRMAPRHRPHYTATERWRILELAALHGWTRDDSASRFLIAPATLARWRREAAVTGPSAPLARPQPPVRRFADAVRYLVQLMDRAGFGGNALIARTLLRGGWRVSPETVRRVRGERPIAGPADARGTTVTARRPNHVWSIALLERFWRTIKDAARVRGRPPLSAATLEARLRLTLGWYTTVRQHRALDGATPREGFQGRSRAVAARTPPRGRRGNGTRDTPFTIAFVDPDRTLPVLVRRAA